MSEVLSVSIFFPAACSFPRVNKFDVTSRQNPVVVRITDGRKSMVQVKVVVNRLLMAYITLILKHLDEVEKINNTNKKIVRRVRMHLFTVRYLCTSSATALLRSSTPYFRKM